jgi:hypothetical protein
MKQNKIILNADRASYNWIHRNYCMKQRTAEVRFNYVMMSATFFTNLVWKKEEKQKRRLRCFHQHDWYWKALTSQKKTDLRTILSDHYHEF